MAAPDIFYQFLGFLLQTAPIAILCIAPFDDSALRLPRRKFLRSFLVGILLLSAGFALMSAVIFDPSPANASFVRLISNLYMLAALIAGAVAFCLSVSASPVKKYIVLALLVYYAAAQFIIVNMLCGMIDGLPDHTPLVIYDAFADIFYAILFLAVFPPTYLFLKQEVWFAFSHVKDFKTLRRGCMYVVVAVLLFFVSCYSLSSFKFYYTLSNLSVFLIFAVFILTDCVLFFMLFSEIRLTIQTQELENQLRSFDDQYRRIDADINEARRARHDLRHHLNYISVLNHTGDRAALEEYLKSYDTTIQNLEQLSLCGYPALDNILQYYIESARSQDIDVKTQFYSIWKSPNIDIIDLTVLLGNLLENAIEACCRLAAAQRFIHIWIKQTDAQLLIQVENSCLAPENSRQNFTDSIDFISAKRAPGHGQGLKSIKYVAEKYGGSAEFKKANNVFTVRIVINIPS